MRYLLDVYVSGRSPISIRAVETLRRICESRIPGDYTIDVIDVLQEPDRAEQAKIMATPTVVRSSPPPVRKIIGDLSDEASVLLGLDLSSSASNDWS